MKFAIKVLIVLLSFKAFAARNISYWNGSGEAVRSENGQEWSREKCVGTVGLVVETFELQTRNSVEKYISIYGGLCYRENIELVLRVEGSNLILTQSSFGSRRWVSPELNKVIGQFDGKSFHYKFTESVEPDKVVFLHEGALSSSDLNSNSATIAFSTSTQMAKGDKYVTLVTGVVKR